MKGIYYNLIFKLRHRFGYSFEVECEGEPQIHTPPGLPECLISREQLGGIITNVIFQSSVGHAAVNFLQFDYGCYAPNVPALLKGKIPTEEDKGQIFMHRIKDTLPGRENSLEQAGAAFVLSEFSEDEVFLLPKNEKNQAKWLFTELEAKLVFDKFLSRLEHIENSINERNNILREKGKIPYEVLLPSRIPYGIAI